MHARNVMMSALLCLAMSLGASPALAGGGRTAPVAMEGAAAVASARTMPIPDSGSWPTTRSSKIAKRGYVGTKGAVRKERPRNTKKWKKRAARAIVKVLNRSSSRQVAAAARFGWWGCAFALARFVAEYGIPIFKVAKVLKVAIKEWKSIDRIVDAIRAGDASEVLGEDGVDVLKAFLGAGTLVDECGSSII